MYQQKLQFKTNLSQIDNQSKNSVPTDEDIYDVPSLTRNNCKAFNSSSFATSSLNTSSLNASSFDTSASQNFAFGNDIEVDGVSAYFASHNTTCIVNCGVPKKLSLPKRVNIKVLLPINSQLSL